jgi:hypothetical protein
MPEMCWKLDLLGKLRPIDHFGVITCLAFSIASALLLNHCSSPAAMFTAARSFGFRIFRLGLLLRLKLQPHWHCVPIVGACAPSHVARRLQVTALKNFMLQRAQLERPFAGKPVDIQHLLERRHCEYCQTRPLLYLW